VLETFWPRHADPVRLRRRAIAGDIQTYQFFCSGEEKEPPLDHITVSLPVQSAVAGTNFHFQCLVSDLDQPRRHTIVPAVVVVDGVVECHAPVSSAAVSITARETLAPPAEEIYGSASDSEKDPFVPVDGFSLEVPPIPLEVEQSQLPMAIIVTCSTVLAVILAVVCACFRSSWAAAWNRALRGKLLAVRSQSFRCHSRLPEPDEEKESSFVEFVSANKPKTKETFVELTEAKVHKFEAATDEATGSNGGCSTAKLYSALDEAGVQIAGGSSDSALTPSIDIVFDEDLASLPRAESWDDADVDDSAGGIQPVSIIPAESTSTLGVSAAFTAAQLPSPSEEELSDGISDYSSEVTEDILLE